MARLCAGISAQRRNDGDACGRDHGVGYERMDRCAGVNARLHLRDLHNRREADSAGGSGYDNNLFAQRFEGMNHQRLLLERSDGGL